MVLFTSKKRTTLTDDLGNVPVFFFSTVCEKDLLNFVSLGNNNFYDTKMEKCYKTITSTEDSLRLHEQL